MCKLMYIPYIHVMPFSNYDSQGPLIHALHAYIYTTCALIKGLCGTTGDFPWYSHSTALVVFPRAMPPVYDRLRKGTNVSLISKTHWFYVFRVYKKEVRENWMSPTGIC